MARYCPEFYRETWIIFLLYLLACASITLMVASLVFFANWNTTPFLATYFGMWGTLFAGDLLFLMSYFLHRHDDVLVIISDSTVPVYYTPAEQQPAVYQQQPAYHQQPVYQQPVYAQPVYAQPTAPQHTVV